MIIEPRMRGFICLTSHPKGCEKNVQNQIDYVKSKGQIDGPKKVLVIGASTGFGLASRITSAFGSNAATIGVFFEKPPQEGKTASPGFYNSAAFHNAAKKAGLYAKSINGDAFSNEIKEKTIALIKADLGQIDLVIYSLASPVRVHPVSGVTHRSVLKPIGSTFCFRKLELSQSSLFLERAGWSLKRLTSFTFMNVINMHPMRLSFSLFYRPLFLSCFADRSNPYVLTFHKRILSLK